MISKTAALLLAPFVLTACATSGTVVKPAGIEVAIIEQVSKCSYLDTVFGTSSLYGVFAEKGIENARLSAFEKAMNLGGTHVVWEAVSPSHGTSQVGAKVFKCS
jgi:hypothetical protein